METTSDIGIPLNIEMAIKCSLDIFYFKTPCMLSVLFAPSTDQLDPQPILSAFNSLPNAPQFTIQIKQIASSLATSSDVFTS
jgi:hypothetical protein